MREDSSGEKMTHEEYVAAVLRGEYPADPLPPMPRFYESKAGMIQNLLFGECKSVAVIHSRQGTFRSDHYHKTDWHFMYVVSGEMHYWWRAAGDERKPSRIDLPAGAMVFTPPMVEHLTFFPVPTTIITMARNIRDHKGHESDIVRVHLNEALAKP